MRGGGGCAGRDSGAKAAGGVVGRLQQCRWGGGCGPGSGDHERGCGPTASCEAHHQRFRISEFSTDPPQTHHLSVVCIRTQCRVQNTTDGSDGWSGKHFGYVLLLHEKSSGFIYSLCMKSSRHNVLHAYEGCRVLLETQVSSYCLSEGVQLKSLALVSQGQAASMLLRTL